MAAPRKEKTPAAPLGRYLRGLTLENVRTFDSEVRLDFCLADGSVAQWTVILGENGTGKTTLLQYLAGMTPVSSRQVNADARLPSGHWFSPKFWGDEWLSWHRANFPSRDLQWAAEKSEPTRDYVGSMKAILYWSVPAASLDSAEAPGKSHRPFMFHLPFNVKERELLPMRQRAWQRFDSDLENEFRLFGYGASRHVAGAASPYISSDTFFQNGGSDQISTLFHDDYPLISPEQWLLGLDHTSNLEGPVGKAARVAFESANRCLKSALPGVEDLMVRPQKTGKAPPVMTLMCKTPFGEVPFSALSVGYRTMAAWLTDFIKRMHEAFPEMEEPDNGPAVVLIDEFDLHMHPKWQREAMAALGNEFPNTQFIVTAHSPLVVQATEGDARIIVLRRKRRHDGTEEVEVINDPHYAAGWRVDQILASDLYDLPPRSPKYDALMKERIALRQKDKRTPAEEKHLAKIEKQLDNEAPPESAPGTDKLLSKLERALDRAEAKQNK